MWLKGREGAEKKTRKASREYLGVMNMADLVLNQQERHIWGVGSIWVRLQSLEFLLRTFLFTIDDASKHSGYHKLRTGQEVPENPFTDYASLGDLIKKYNKIIASEDPDLQVCTSVVELRDAMAHGRIAGHTEHGPMHLLRFDKPNKDQKVKVLFATEMSDAWFWENIRLVVQQIKKVVTAAKRMNMREISAYPSRTHMRSPFAGM